MKKITQKKKKIKVKNTVPHLLMALVSHKDCPVWLDMKIWNTLTDNSNIPAKTVGFFKQALKYSCLSRDAETNNYEVIR
jgi:hypothetical protein